MAAKNVWALFSAAKGSSFAADNWQKIQDQEDTLGITFPWFLEGVKTKEEAKMREKQQREHEGQRKGEEVKYWSSIWELMLIEDAH